MKKSITRLTCFTLVLIMLASIFAACDKTPNLDRMTEEERANAIFDTIENDEFGDSYTVKAKMDVVGSMEGARYELTMNGTSYYTAVGSDSPEHHEEREMEMKLEVAGNTVTQKAENASGYRGGKMYKSEKEDGKSFALASAISYEDYKKHREAIAKISDADISAAFKSASAKTTEKFDDGSRCATFSGYSEEKLSLLLTDLLADDMLFEGYKVKDITMTATVTEDLKPIEVKYILSFERTDLDNLYTEPKCEMTATFKDIDQTNLPSVDLADYKEVEGLAQMLEIQNLITELKNEDIISFVADSTTKAEFAGQTATVVEIDSVNSYIKDGDYRFTIRAKFNPDTNTQSIINFKYEEGSFIISGKNVETTTQEMSKREAKAYIGKVLDPANLASAFVSDIKPNEGGYTYVFTISDPDYSAIKDQYASLNATNFKAQAEVGVKYENGVISEYKYNLLVTASIQGQALTVTASSTVTINNDDGNS